MTLRVSRGIPHAGSCLPLGFRRSDEPMREYCDAENEYRYAENEYRYAENEYCDAEYEYRYAEYEYRYAEYEYDKNDRAEAFSYSYSVKRCSYSYSMWFC
jgi:hypothetical protein